MITPWAMSWYSMARLLTMNRFVIEVKKRDPEDRADDGAAGRRQGSAADDHGGDGLQLVRLLWSVDAGVACAVTLSAGDAAAQAGTARR
jgi:hypothetical protein